MIHGPGGGHNPSSVCMKNGTCSKGFPKPFLRYTEQSTDSYPKYRKRHPSNTKGREHEKVVDNQWVVLYNTWHHSMEKAAVSATSQSLRFLLVIIITQCNPRDLRTLWLRNKSYLAEDFRQSAPTIDAVKNNAIVELDDIVLAMDGLEKPRRDASERLGQDYRRELMYDLEAQREISERCKLSMTSDQQHVFTTFIQADQNKQKGVCFP